MSKSETSSNYKEKARAAADKKGTLGEDIDLSKYIVSDDEYPYQSDPSNLPREAKEQMLTAGVILDDPSQRSGTYIQMDNTPVHSSITEEGVEVMPVSQAMEKYDWFGDYWWKVVAVDQDKYTANIELNHYNGYFIRALPGQKMMLPVQACLYLAKEKLMQNVHNVIIAEEDSEMHIITGCTTATADEPGLHLGVSEFYVKRGAKITFTMMNPLARCIGDNATARFNSILVTGEGSSLDSGSRVILDGKGSRTEIISRAITTGGNILARGYIEGNAPDVKGHLECRGLILGEKGVIHAIPELKGTLAGIDLSHEAAVGKIAEEEVEYLMARGLTRDEATAAIVRGFLRVDIEGLPPLLSAELKRAVEASEKDVM
jgi:Fe-S cluster assembly scaffold protein SufB